MNSADQWRWLSDLHLELRSETGRIKPVELTPNLLPFSSYFEFLAASSVLKPAVRMFLSAHKCQQCKVGPTF